MKTALEIIIPAKDPDQRLRSTVRSLADQNVKSFAVIISLNGENNGTVELCRKMLLLVGIHSTVIHQPYPLGRIEHWNKAIAATEKGEWIKPLFCGDTLEPEYIQSIRPIIDAGNHDAVLCHYWQRDHYGTRTLRNCAGRFGVKLAPPLASAFTHGAFIKAGRYSDKFPIFSDSLLATCMDRNCRMAMIKTPLATFNEHQDRYSYKTRGTGLIEYLRFLYAALRT